MSHSPDYSFARKPVWLIGHLVALTAIAGFALLGTWQLSRHDERAVLDSALEDRLAMSPLPLEQLMGDSDDVTSRIEYRSAVVSGSYRPEDEVILQARSLDGRSGHEVLTPLDLDDGTAVIVNRGWVPIDVEGPPVAVASPPAGVVTVTGYVRQTQIRSGLGPIDAPDGTLDRISRVDLDRLQAQTDITLQAVWLQLATQTPPQAELPFVVDPPQPGGGPPHLAYAFQWFAFTGVVALSYPILMYRTARRTAEEPGTRRR